jgi:hypothetical protein
MLHDEKEFGPKTEEFRPERFFEPGVADPLNIAFGFGRRYARSNPVDLSVLMIGKKSLSRSRLGHRHPLYRHGYHLEDV